MTTKISKCFYCYRSVINMYKPYFEVILYLFAFSKRCWCNVVMIFFTLNIVKALRHTEIFTSMRLKIHSLNFENSSEQMNYDGVMSDITIIPFFSIVYFGKYNLQLSKCSPNSIKVPPKACQWNEVRFFFSTNFFVC